MNTVQIIRPEEGLTPEVGAAVFELLQAVWPPAPNSPPPDVAGAVAGWHKLHPASFLVWDEPTNQLVAHARLFRREIFTSHGPLQMGALAAVGVHPNERGKGYGAAVVRAAFEFLPQLGTPVSLFQTPIPRFYENLGCRGVENSFFDGTRADGSRENPFWEQHVLIYPGAFDWPEGDIDLNGPGY